jgi:hypothetical protein
MGVRGEPPLHRDEEEAGATAGLDLAVREKKEAEDPA